MKHWTLVFCAGTLVALGAGYFFLVTDANNATGVPGSQSYTAQEEVGFDAEPPEKRIDYRLGQGGWYSVDELNDWERASEPLRVGVQVGHLENDEVPEELVGLTRNGAGATAAGYNERDTVAVIAELVATELRQAGIVVDVLPTTVPPKYEADAFVSIHADGNPNTAVRGFKIAGPRRDYSGQAEALVTSLYESYDAITGFPQDPSISRRMTAYYAFNWARYEHAVHPFTPAVIVETGFLTNATDRTFLLNEPERAAEGIAQGIVNFLDETARITAAPRTIETPTLPLTGTVICAPVREERRNRSERPCEASIMSDDGTHYMLLADPEIATATLPYRARVYGQYMPVQMLDNYFWFHWEVEGIIDVAALENV